MRLMAAGAVVLTANLFDAGMVLLRNILLARLLTVEQFGIVATFTILSMLLESIQNSGLNRLVVQAPDGDDPKVQGTIHTVQLFMSVSASLALLAVSWPYAALMNTPGLVLTYCFLAIVPIFRGFTHLGILRFQRAYRFGPIVARQLLSQLAGLVVIWPAYIWLGDYRVILVSILAQNSVALFISHWKTPQPYGFGIDRAVMRRAFSFGWPVLANGILIFFVINGDRMIVANQFGHTTLGWFSAAFMLTLMPTNLVANTLQSVILPVLANCQGNPLEFQRRYDLAISLVMSIVVIFVAGVALVGPIILTLFFGSKYAAGAPYLLLLAIMHGLRITRATSLIAATAKAETKLSLYGNVVRGLFIPAALGVSVATNSVYWMISFGILGEAVSAVASAYWLKTYLDVRSRHFLKTFIPACILIGLVAAVFLIDIRAWVLLPAAALFLLSNRRLLEARSLFVIRHNPSKTN